MKRWGMVGVGSSGLGSEDNSLRLKSTAAWGDKGKTGTREQDMMGTGRGDDI